MTAHRLKRYHVKVVAPLRTHEDDRLMATTVWQAAREAGYAAQVPDDAESLTIEVRRVTDDAG